MKALITAWTLLAADYRQTVDICRDGDEMNPIMGRHGELAMPALYFVTCAMLLLWCSVMLPKRWNHRMMIIVILMQMYVIVHNVMTGGYWPI